MNDPSKRDRDRDRLEYIVEVIAKIEHRLGEIDLADFVEDDDDIDLLAFRLSQIGEASGKLSDAVKASHPSLPWKQISGMRNLIVHDYQRVIPARLWNTAKHDLPPLRAACQRTLDGGPV